MKSKNKIIYLILLISLLVNSFVFAETNEEFFLFNVELLLDSHEKEIYPIYQSPFMENEMQIRETIKFLLKRGDVKRILTINNIPFEETEFYNEDLFLDTDKEMEVSNEEYKKTDDIPMAERDNDNKIIKNNSTDFTNSTEINVKINNEIVGIKGYMVNGRVLVPFRPISELLGIKVGYVFRENLKVIWGIKYDIKVDMKIDDLRAYRNGNLLYMDSYPVIKGGMTYLPIRYFVELFDYEIKWEQQEDTVNIVSRSVKKDEE